jgi:hypothetical protein
LETSDSAYKVDGALASVNRALMSLIVSKGLNGNGMEEEMKKGGHLPMGLTLPIFALITKAGLREGNPVSSFDMVMVAEVA